jgi:hypothetical protein
MEHQDLEKSHVTGLYEPKSNIYGAQADYGAATVAEASGRGGDTHRGLKSRHIQFLYVYVYLVTSNMLILLLEPSEELLALDYSSARAVF